MPNVVVYVNDEIYFQYKELTDVEDKEIKGKMVDLLESFIKKKKS